jgi:hypothetical protein
MRQMVSNTKEFSHDGAESTATYWTWRVVACRGGTLKAVTLCLCILGVTPVAGKTSEMTLVLFSCTLASYQATLLDVGAVFLWLLLVDCGSTEWLLLLLLLLLFVVVLFRCRQRAKYHSLI